MKSNNDPNLTNFVFPILLIMLSKGTQSNIQVINDIDVKDTICEAVNFLTIVRNNISIATPNNKFPDNPTNHGNNLLNFVRSYLYSISFLP